MNQFPLKKMFPIYKNSLIRSIVNVAGYLTNTINRSGDYTWTPTMDFATIMTADYGGINKCGVNEYSYDVTDNRNYKYSYGIINTTAYTKFKMSAIISISGTSSSTSIDQILNVRIYGLTEDGETIVLRDNPITNIEYNNRKEYLLFGGENNTMYDISAYDYIIFDIDNVGTSDYSSWYLYDGILEPSRSEYIYFQVL